MSKTYSFSIEGCTPDEIPMRRLGKYLDCLAALMRYSDAVHLHGITEGGTQFPMEIKAGYEQLVSNHIDRLRIGDGGKRATVAVTNINKLLARDNRVFSGMIHATMVAIVSGFQARPRNNTRPLDHSARKDLLTVFWSVSAGQARRCAFSLPTAG